MRGKFHTGRLWTSSLGGCWWWNACPGSSLVYGLRASLRGWWWKINKRYVCSLTQPNSLESLSLLRAVSVHGRSSCIKGAVLNDAAVPFPLLLKGAACSRWGTHPWQGGSHYSCEPYIHSHSCFIYVLISLLCENVSFKNPESVETIAVCKRFLDRFKVILQSGWPILFNFMNICLHAS